MFLRLRDVIEILKTYKLSSMARIWIPLTDEDEGDGDDEEEDENSTPGVAVTSQSSEEISNFKQPLLLVIRVIIFSPAFS